MRVPALTRTGYHQGTAPAMAEAAGPYRAARAKTAVVCP